MANFFETITTNFTFLKRSLRFFGKNKDLIFFPILSIFASIAFIILTVFTGIMAKSPFENLLQNHNTGILIAILIMIYFTLSFITIYFNAALIACATLRLQGQKASIRDGFSLAAKKSWPILQWSIVGSSVGFIIRGIENSHNLLEKIIGFILGISWTVCAYFVLPVIIFENIGPFKALKRAYEIFGKGWQKIVAVNFIFGLIFFALFILIALSLRLFPNESDTLILTSVALFFCIILFIATVGNALNSIVCSALYLKILQQKDPQGFEAELLTKAFKKKPSSQNTLLQ